MSHLDKNIRKLLEQAPPPEPWQAGVPDAIFERVVARLDKDHMPGRARLYGWVAVAAAALLALIVGWRAFTGPRPSLPPSSTGTGQPEQPQNATRPETPKVTPREREVVKRLAPPPGESMETSLPDGTNLVVDGGSNVVIVTSQERARPIVKLEKGAITCEVARGPDRFKVKTPLGEVIALGTKFSVRLLHAQEEDTATPGQSLKALEMIVSVISGEVIVRDNSGLEQVAAAGETVKVAKGAAAKVIENWRSGQLVPKLEDGSQGPPLVVRKHNVKVTITEQVALVEVDETFYNPSERRMEGTFYFPLPHGATICRLAMYVGDSLMEGEIAETKRARRTFEALMVQRIDPALLEWAGGNNFKMRVFPIEPKSEKRVLISFYQLLKKERGRIRFTYPLVSDALNTHPVGEVNINVSVRSTPEISDVVTPGYVTRIKAGEHDIEVQFNAKKISPSKDFSLEYRVAAGQSLVAIPYWHKKDGEGYFIMIFAPRLDEADSEKKVPNRLIFVLDKSGGLGTRHLKLAVTAVKAALKYAMETLNYRFGIVAYDTFAEKFSDKLVPSTTANLEKAFEWLDNLNAMGASDLGTAWNAAAQLAGNQEAMVIYVGSGLSSLTSTRPGKLLAQAKAAFSSCNVSIHALALGTVVDAVFLDALARAHDGIMRPIRNADDVAAYVPELLDDYGYPLYKDLQVEISGVETAEIYPLSLPNLTAGRQLFIFGKYLSQGTARVKLKASYNDQPFEQSWRVDLDSERRYRFVPRLWATRKIEHLQQQAALAGGDAAQAIVRTIIETSKRYRVMSQYTSFIVLETAEDYLRFGIERREDEFDDEMAEMNAAADKNLANRAGIARPPRPSETLEKAKSISRQSEYKQRGTPQEKQQLGQALRRRGRADAGNGRKRNADRPALAASKAKKKADGKAYLFDRAEDIDVMAWERTNIFPTFGRNRLGARPRRWKGDPNALQILKSIAGQYKALFLKLSTFRLATDGKEIRQGRETVIAFDRKTRAFFYRKLGDDHTTISDGKIMAQTFPLLKYAAKRLAEPGDLEALASQVPGFLVPWAEKLDREFMVSMERGHGRGIIIRLQCRYNRYEYTLLYLESEKGPVRKIEIYKRRYDRGWKTYKYKTIVCEAIKEYNGVRVPTVFRIIEHTRRLPKPAAVLEYKGKKIAVLDASRANALVERIAALRSSKDPNAQRALAEAEKELTGMGLAAEGTTTVVRLGMLRVNEKLGPDLFKIVIPEDWSVRDLDVRPNPRDRRSISAPVNPSPHFRGRRWR